MYWFNVLYSLFNLNCDSRIIYFTPKVFFFETFHSKSYILFNLIIFIIIFTIGYLMIKSYLLFLVQNSCLVFLTINDQMVKYNWVARLKLSPTMLFSYFGPIILIRKYQAMARTDAHLSLGLPIKEMNGISCDLWVPLPPPLL